MCTQVPVLTPWLIPLTEMVALAIGMPCSSVTTPLMPRWTCRKVKGGVRVQAPAPRGPSGQEPPGPRPGRRIPSQRRTCSMKVSRASLLFSHSRGSSLS